MHCSVQHILKSVGTALVLSALSQSGAYAQSLRISTEKLTIGAPLQGEYATPEGDNQPGFAIGIRPKGQTAYIWKQGISKQGPGSMKLGTPNNPGRFEAVLYDSNNKVHAVKPFRTIVTATPGALRADKSSYIVGEPISITARKDKNRFYGNGWIGLFHQGAQGDGGASIADGRITWQRIPAAGKQAVFRAPGNPGAYEFRLFDRDNWWYVLDRIAVKVTVPPTPGVMSVQKKVFTIGETVTLKVAMKPGRHYGNSWIGLFRDEVEVPGGGKVLENRLTWQRANLKTKTLKFKAPSTPGKYAFRLYDRDAKYFILDSLEFDTVVPPTPGVMKLSKQTFTVGEPISLAVALETGRHYGNSWIGLYRSEIKTEGGATRDRRRLTWQRANLKTKSLTFTAPGWPGDYEFMLFDRDGGLYQLDRLPFKVEVPATPGVMSLAAKKFTIGAPIALGVKLKPGRHYGNSWIGLFRKEYAAKGGAKIAKRRVSWQRANLKTTQLKFTAPAWAGGYEFRLYDRDGENYMLDSIDFETVVPTTPNVLSLTKNSFVTGEAFQLAVAMEPGRYYGNSWIGLYRRDNKSESGAGIRYDRITWQRAKPQTKSLDWKAPGWPGDYEFRLFDRGNGQFQIASLPFTVRATPQGDILSVQKRRYRPGELVRVKIKPRPDRHRGHHWVELVGSSHRVDGGAIVGEYRVKSYSVGKNNKLAFQAPKQAGPYELRYYDRGGIQFILDIKRFDVAATPPDGVKRERLRFTPMPGRQSAALQPGTNDSGGENDGLPGRPVRPDGSPTEDPKDQSGKDGAEDGTKDGANDGAGPKDEAKDGVAGGPPKLKFLAIGSSGLADVGSIKRGQPFIIEARYAKPPARETVSAQMSFGTDGKGQTVTLHRADDNGTYRSGVIRLPPEVKTGRKN